MTTEDTENQAGGAEPNDGTPQPDAPPTPQETLHANAEALIIASRRLGIEIFELIKQKIADMADK
jgi:hypothetical protein